MTRLRDFSTDPEDGAVLPMWNDNHGDLILPHVLYGCETSPLTQREEAGDIDLLPLILLYICR